MKPSHFMYFASQTNVLRRNLANPSWWGLMQTPQSTREPFHWWSVGDSGAFNKKFIWEEYKAWLIKKKKTGELFYFATCPDVVGNAKMTMELYRIYYSQIKALDYPVAFVVQDGQEDFEIPPCDWLFIGGTTRFKLSTTVASIITHYKKVLPIHVGRVSSPKRMIRFFHWGAQTVDGTTLNYGNQDAKWRELNEVLIELNFSSRKKIPQPILFEGVT